VFDDVIAEIGENQKAALKGIFFNRRHILPKGCISIIVTTQKFTIAPLWLRSVANLFVMFGCAPN
jgi:hypothetical protein